MNIFSERLKQALNERGMKPIELSELTGISKSSISDWINGKYEAKSDKILLIAKALNVNESFLIGLQVPMDNDTKKLNQEKNINNKTVSELIEIMNKLDEAGRSAILKFAKYELAQFEGDPKDSEGNITASWDYCNRMLFQYNL